MLEKITQEAEYTCKDFDVPLTYMVTIKAGQNFYTDDINKRKGSHNCKQHYQITQGCILQARLPFTLSMLSDLLTLPCCKRDIITGMWTVRHICVENCMGRFRWKCFVILVLGLTTYTYNYFPIHACLMYGTTVYSCRRIGLKKLWAVYNDNC